MTDVANQVKDINTRVKKDLGDDFEVKDPTKGLGDEFTSQAPEGTAPTDVTPYKSMKTKAYERFWGTDVQDPIPWTRFGSTVLGGVAGGALGVKGGAALGAGIGAFAGPEAVPIGAAIGAVAGGLAGSAAGTYVGAGAPEGLHDLAESIGLRPPDKPGKDRAFTLTGLSKGLNEDDLKTVMEGEALLDTITGGGVAAARLFTRGGIRLVTGMGRDEVRMADEAGVKGIDMLPVQLGERRLPRAFVSVLGKFPIISMGIRGRMVRAEDAYKKAFEALPADIAPLAARDNISLSLMTDASSQWKKVSGYFGKRYDDIFARADAAGAKVNPENTAQKVLDVTDWIKKSTPSGIQKGKKVRMDEELSALNSFLSAEIRPMFKATKTGLKGTAPQTFQQMDRMLTSIDNKIGEFGKSGYNDAMMRLEDLKNSIRQDMYFKVTGVDPQTVANIAADFQATDKVYSETVNDLFETSVAKRFGTVKKGGIRGAKFDSERMTNVDQLADILMRGDSTDDLLDLQKIVQPSTFKELTAYTIDKRMRDAFEPGQSPGMHAVNLESLQKGLGLDKPNSPRYNHTKKMLELAGGLQMTDIEKMIGIGNKLSQVEIPNPSTFIMRRGTMGGLNAILGGIMPTIGTAGAGAAAAGSGGSFIATSLFLGGSHVFARMISDPLAAKSLKLVMRPELSKAVKKKAIIRATGTAVEAMVRAGEYTEQEGANMFSWLRAGAEYVGLMDEKQGDQ